MIITMHVSLSFANDEEGYKFANDWCEKRKKGGVTYKMSETTTSIELEEWYGFDHSFGGEDDVTD